MIDKNIIMPTNVVAKENKQFSQKLKCRCTPIITLMTDIAITKAIYRNKNFITHLFLVSVVSEYL